jgi:hypothetical protein
VTNGDEGAFDTSLAELVQSLQLSRVRLKTLVVRAGRVAELEEGAEGEVGIQSKASTVARHEGGITFEIGVRVWAPSQAPAEAAPLLIQVERLLEYGGLPRGTSDELVAEFCRTSVALSGWPYLRADVHHACLEADIPPLLLPLWKSPALAARTEVDAGSPTPAWPSWRERLSDLLESVAPLFDDRHSYSLLRTRSADGHDAVWPYLVEALASHYGALTARLARGHAGDAGALFDEAWELLQETRRVLDLRAEHYRKTQPEAVTRWNETASEAERLFRSAARVGLFKRDGSPKLARLKA